MAVCTFAKWLPISGSSGPHLGGPFKIVHHTTEGSSAAGAFGAFRTNRSDPHFTVDATTIYQHIDTNEGARALRNDPGGVQTNRDSAIQIELVGFAHLRKNPKALINVARLCRWIEQTHGVPRKWPAGVPKTSTTGKDPGGHNRPENTWDNESGHFGHCHVPENSHWDPGYTQEEVDFLMSATFDAKGSLIAPQPPAISAASGRKLAAAKPHSTMPDHAFVRERQNAYVHELVLAELNGLPPLVKPAAKRAVTRKKKLQGVAVDSSEYGAAVNVGSLVSFVDGISAQERGDVLSSLQLAQRGASGAFDRFTNTREWYRKYLEILENLGWTADQFAFTAFDQADQEFQMDHAALAIIAAIATQNQLAILKASLDALAKLKDDSDALRLFESNSVLEGSGNFQLGAVQKTAQGAIALALGAFYFKSSDHRRRVLFFKWGHRSLNFWTSAQRMVLNTEIYALRRAEIEARLSADSARYIAELKLS
jgi:hypothetical protein